MEVNTLVRLGTMEVSTMEVSKMEESMMVESMLGESTLVESTLEPSTVGSMLASRCVYEQDTYRSFYVLRRLPE